MRIAVFGIKADDRQFLDTANLRFGHQLSYFEPRLDLTPAVLAAGISAVYVFVNDRLDAPVLMCSLHPERGSSRWAALVSTTSTSPPPTGLA